MSDLRPEGAVRRTAPPDEEYAAAYSEGYGDGLREALREFLAHTTRGHSTQELRYLIESRLLRVREEVEVKRRNLLGPPRRATFGPLFRSSADRPLEARPPAVTIAPMLLEPGQSYLFREERPGGALEFVAAHGERFPRLVALGARAPADPRIPSGRWVSVPLARLGGQSGEGFDPAAAGGRVREATEQDGGALVYSDALEFLSTEYGVEATLKFVNFLVSQARRTNSVLVVSADPRSFKEPEQSRLQRLFNIVR